MTNNKTSASKIERCSRKEQYYVALIVWIDDKISLDKLDNYFASAFIRFGLSKIILRDI
jgi:hypothetical protein